MKAGANLGDDPKRDGWRECDSRLVDRTGQLVERLTLDPFHCQKEHALVFAEVQNLRDIGVSDARCDPCLIEEHLLETRIARVAGEDGLDGDELLESVFAEQSRNPNAGHPASADWA